MQSLGETLTDADVSFVCGLYAIGNLSKLYFTLSSIRDSSMGMTRTMNRPNMAIFRLKT